MRLRRNVLCTALIGTTVMSAAEQAPKLSLTELREVRKEMAFRKRGIIANNDGCDCLYFPKTMELTPETFLARRTTPLAGTQVGAISYCSISSGFGHFTHNTNVGTILTRQSADYGILPTHRNVTQDLIDMGADCLQLVGNFAKANDLEILWSFRMNDTHDVSHHPDRPYLLYPKLKEEHPEWLVGDHVKRTPKGRWSSVNYALPEVRDLAFKFIEEVCVNYNVDGVELDYFRHLCYLPSVANGGKASQEEADMITDLMRHVRSRTEELGMARGRPYLVAIRVADSAGFNRDMGLDVERWLEEGLVDILITTGYFRLSPWETTVAMGHKHGVAVYPCLADSRIRGGTRFNRMSAKAYRGRAANAWAAGADGIYTFNSFNPNAPLWKEIGAESSLVGQDKLFYVTVRDGDPSSWLAGGANYANVPMLAPSYPAGLQIDKPHDVRIAVGEDIAAGVAAGKTPTVTCHAELINIKTATQMTMTLNGTTLKGHHAEDDWYDFAVPPDALVRGGNVVTMTANPAPPALIEESQWAVTFDGKGKPGRPWEPDPGSTRIEEELTPAGFRIADAGTVSGDYRYYRAGWGMADGGTGVIEARVKVIGGINCVIFGTGHSGDRLRLTPEGFRLHHNSRLKVEMNTTDDFHLYRIELNGREVRVFVDGVLKLTDPNALAPRRYRCEVAFGAASSSEVGEAVWGSVRAQAKDIVCRDLLISVNWQ